MTAILEGWIAERSTARETMERMRKFVRAALADPSFVYAAREIVSRAAERDEPAQAQTLRKWMQQHFQFVKDPDGREDQRDPRFMLNKIQANGKYFGDCDDAATLAAALAKAIGMPATFMAVAFAPGDAFRHVYTVIYPLDRKSKARRPLEMDVTRPADIPQLPRFARRMPVVV